MTSPRLDDSSNLSPPALGSQDNTASTPQPHSPAETWLLFTTYRQVFHYHPGFPAGHPLLHHVPHHKTQPACTHPGQALHHKLPQQLTPTLPLTLGNVHGPATASHTTWANYNNIQPPALRQLLRNFYQLCDSIPTHGYCCFLFASLTDFLGERKIPPRNRILFTFTLPTHCSSCLPLSVRSHLTEQFLHKRAPSLRHDACR